jgi:eukaryotic-like serine/threonine-protein kinase
VSTLHPKTMLGRVFNSYTITALAGQGTAGQVYKARHNFFGGDYAVKVLVAGRDRPDVEARFLREAQAARKIKHANIVEVVDFGKTDDGLSFLVMEWLDGESLASVIAREAPLSPKRVEAIVRQIAAGLGAAHDAGLIHRDLKPANIMLVGRDKSEVKIVDFGLVRDPGSDKQGRLTQPGVLLGTPWYMAPELIAVEPVSPATDLYALGAIMYEMLVGRPLFPAETLPDILSMHLSSPLPPMPEAGGLEQIIPRLLAKKAKDRLQSAAQLLRLFDTKSLAVDSQDATATMTTPYAARARDRPGFVARAVVITVLMLVFVAGVVLIGNSLRRPETPVVNVPAVKPDHSNRR